MSSFIGSQEPLKNIRVLDLSRVFAMPFAGANLADLGAEVIKVDTCQTQFMDTTRTITGPFPDNEPGKYWWEQGGTFQNLNRGKRSLTHYVRSEKSEDIIKDNEAEIQKITDDHILKLNTLQEEKEKEILEV